MLKIELLKRKRKLQEYAAKIGKWMLTAPEGKLWTSVRQLKGNRSCRYLLEDRRELSPVNDKKRIKDLAKKEYLQKSLIAIKKELKAIDSLLDCVDLLPQTYSKLQEAKRELVFPIEIPVQETITRFTNEKPVRSPRKIDNPKPTDRGDVVRSWPEALIANALREAKLAYIYEKPFTLFDGHVVYPDFSIIHPVSGELFLWEHFGRMDTAWYSNETVMKIKDYMKSGMHLGKNLIATFDNEEYKLTKEEIRLTIQAFFLPVAYK